MQHASAYQGVTYTGSTVNVRGLCPDGWSLPTGGTGGDFEVLHIATGSSNTGFWQTPGNWKGSFSGYCPSTGSLNYQGSYGFWWSSTSYSAPFASYLYFVSSSAIPNANGGYKSDGYPIRCLKD